MLNNQKNSPIVKRVTTIIVLNENRESTFSPFFIHNELTKTCSYVYICLFIYALHYYI